jgi:large subunit ribosomal protein L21
VYAIIRSGGHQVKVEPGRVVAVDHLGAEQGQTVEFDQVLLIASDDGQIVAGSPYIADARVVGIVEGDRSGPKIRVFKKKRRKGMKRTKGHRTTFSQVRVTEIQA